MKQNLPLIIIAAVLALAFGLGVVLYKTMKPTAAPAPGNSNTPSAPLPGADPPRMRGGANAAVTIEEFGDFECPPCGILHPELIKVEREYGDRLRVIFRQFPLTQIHKYAYDAARAAEAAGMQNKFWEMHDLLYEKKEEWSLAPDPRTMFVEYAKVLGMDGERFSRDMLGDLAALRVGLDMRRGKSMGVTGTPTLFINGRKMDPSEMTPDGLRAAVNKALYGAGQ